MAGAPFIVTLVGDLDMGNLDQLGVAFQDFRRSAAADVRVVMTELTFMDSIRTLSVAAAASRRGRAWWSGNAGRRPEGCAPRAGGDPHE